MRVSGYAAPVTHVAPIPGNPAKQHRLLQELIIRHGLQSYVLGSCDSVVPRTTMCNTSMRNIFMAQIKSVMGTLQHEYEAPSARTPVGVTGCKQRWRRHVCAEALQLSSRNIISIIQFSICHN